MLGSHVTTTKNGNRGSSWRILFQAKQTFMKRARSVAIFSLKLKERRAKEGGTAETAPKSKEKPSPRTPVETATVPMGELSYIPIEKLIQLEDVRKNK